jgi:hypothetical protein
MNALYFREKKMKSRFASTLMVAIALILPGCVTYQPTIPEGYTGSRTTITDSVTTHSDSKADFFYVEAVNGHDVENSRIKTAIANQGRGMSMTPVILGREIPTQPTTLTLVGRTAYAAPILAMTNTVYEVKGNVQFAPEPGKSYVVKGELAEDHSAVWLEETDGNPVEGTKVEIQGAAEMGFFDK